MPNLVPEDWRKAVVAILKGRAPGRVEVRYRAMLEWQALFPESYFEYQLRDAFAKYLARDDATGRPVTDMTPPGIVYEFIFEHCGRLVYGKVGLHQTEKTVVIVFSAHRPLKGDTL